MNQRILACCLALGSALLAAAPLLALQHHTSPAHPQHPVSRDAASPRSLNTGEEGQRLFDQNCARCHNAPDGFSPRITGTIVRHMRVRAGLSRHDEEVLLRYFIQ